MKKPRIWRISGFLQSCKAVRVKLGLSSPGLVSAPSFGFLLPLPIPQFSPRQDTDTYTPIFFFHSSFIEMKLHITKFTCFFFKIFLIFFLFFVFVFFTVVGFVTHWNVSAMESLRFERYNSVVFSISSVQFSRSVVSESLWLPVHHQLLEPTQTHVHWVDDAIQPSHPLSSPSPPTLNLSQHQGLFQWVSSSHEVAKVLEFQLQHQTFQWTPRTDLL